MRREPARLLLVIAAGCLPAAALAAGAEAGVAEAIQRAAVDYQQQLESATQELVALRERIAAERLPIEKARREAENQVLGLRAAITRSEIEEARTGLRKKRLQAELDGLNQNLAYIASLGRDAADGLNEALLPGEAHALANQLPALREQLKAPENKQNAALAAAAGELVTERLSRAVGGELAPGSCVRRADNELVPGTFAWLGPEVFFLAGGNGFLGAVFAGADDPVPVAIPLPERDAEPMRVLFRGEPASALVDASGGKALRLRDVRGTWLDHVRRGGVIGYGILALGALAIATTVMKLFDLRLMQIDPPQTLGRVLAAVESGPAAEAEKLVASLSPSLRQLFQAGLPHLGKPKGVLEDHLYAALLRQRMRLEQRLPFLTVIVAAAPLLGLLGTVTGMIKTFTLINVFGTGNAAKLSSGISEALVTTEFGLMVAIPTLVVHGYLNRRTQKSLAQMERHAAEFIAAAAQRLASSEAARPRGP